MEGEMGQTRNKNIATCCGVQQSLALRMTCRICGELLTAPQQPAATAEAQSEGEMGQTPGAHRVRQDCTCAACEDTKALARDVARLTRERDEARAQVDKAEKQAAYNAAVAASLADQVNELLAESKDRLDKGSERYNRVAALVEEWRDSKYLRDRVRRVLLDCADELDAALAVGEHGEEK